jgi:hypothetical protein
MRRESREGKANHESAMAVSFPNRQLSPVPSITTPPTRPPRPTPHTPPRRGISSRVRRRRCRRPLPSELHVTVSRHAAQAFTNAPRGTRLLSSISLARGSADGSWHVTTPSCPPCPDRLGCARSDGGCDSRALRFAVVDCTPYIVPLVSSLRIRSGRDLSAFGRVARPTVLPGTVPTPGPKG